MIITTIESILFASGKPVAISVLKKTLGVSDEVLSEVVFDLKSRFNANASGIHLIESDGKLQFVTNPAHAEIVKNFLNQEVIGELTRPSLETLTIIAYRGPITKRLQDAFFGLFSGKTPDKWNWLDPVDGPAVSRAAAVSN